MCRLIIYAIENENLQGSYNAVAPQSVLKQTPTLTLAKIMKGNFSIPFHAPAFVLQIMLGQRSIEVLKSSTVSCKKILDTGFEFRYHNIGSGVKGSLCKIAIRFSDSPCGNN